MGKATKTALKVRFIVLEKSHTVVQVLVRNDELCGFPGKHAADFKFKDHAPRNGPFNTFETRFNLISGSPRKIAQTMAGFAARNAFHGIGHEIPIYEGKPMFDWAWEKVFPPNEDIPAFELKDEVNDSEFYRVFYTNIGIEVYEFEMWRNNESSGLPRVS